jgi:hypothetical protein
MNARLAALSVLHLVVGGGAAYLFAHAAIVTTVLALVILVVAVASTPRSLPVVAAMAGWGLVMVAIALPVFVNHDPAVHYADGSGGFFAVAILIGPLALAAMHLYRRSIGRPTTWVQ